MQMPARLWRAITCRGSETRASRNSLARHRSAPVVAAARRGCSLRRHVAVPSPGSPDTHSSQPRTGRPKPPPQRGRTGGPPRAETVQPAAARGDRLVESPRLVQRRGEVRVQRLQRWGGFQGAIQKRFRCRKVAARERDDAAHVQRLRVRGVGDQQARAQLVRLGEAAESMQLQRFLPHCRKLFARPARRHHRVVLPRQIVMGAMLRTRLRTSVRFARHRRARAALPTEVSQVGSRPRRACGVRSPAIPLTRSFRDAPGAHARADAPGRARELADTRRTPRSSCLRGRALARD